MLSDEIEPADDTEIFPPPSEVIGGGRCSQNAIEVRNPRSAIDKI